jgi:hypothetical protein
VLMARESIFMISHPSYLFSVLCDAKEQEEKEDGDDDEEKEEEEEEEGGKQSPDCIIVPDKVMIKATTQTKIPG